MRSLPLLAPALVAVVTLAGLAPATAGNRAQVSTDNETPVLYDDEKGGHASGDDPAIWVHPRRSERSIVIVTAKEGGLRVYDARDRELQSLQATARPDPGRFNNVDIAYGVRLAGRRVDLAVVSDRYNDTIRLFAIDPAGSRADRPLREVTAGGRDWIFARSQKELESEHTAYGLAVYQPAGGPAQVVVTQEGEAAMAVLRLVPRANGRVGYRVQRRIAMDSTFRVGGETWTPCEEPGVGPQLEGVTVDQATGTLYAAQEDVGLWRVDLRGSTPPVLVDRVRDFGVRDVWRPAQEECVPAPGESEEDNPFGGRIVADAEGVDLWYGPGGTGYLVLSSQGSSEFLVYERGFAGSQANRRVGVFVVTGRGVDRVHGSDGLAITNRPVGRFRQGLLVTHDEPETGADVDDERDATNFSFVSWGKVARSLGLRRPSTVPGNDPRFR
jgi:3-phytase